MTHGKRDPIAELNRPAPEKTGIREWPGDIRSFTALAFTIFQGALSDNIFRFILLLLVIGLAGEHAAEIVAASGEFQDELKIATQLSSSYQFYISAAFILPYILLVGLAGWLADRFPKSSVTRWTKGIEIGVMLLATAVFLFGPTLMGRDYVWLAAGVLFLMGAQSALFSPTRYGIMPEILPDHRLGWGNGIVQGFMFFAIVLGTVLGPILKFYFDSALWIAGLILVGMGCVGLAATMRISPTPIGNPSATLRINFLPKVSKTLTKIYADIGLRWAVIGIMVWWGVAIMLQAGALIVATTTLGLNEFQAGIALTPVVLAQGLGCFLAAFLCRHRIEMGLVPLGALGMFIFSILLWMVLPPGRGADVAFIDASVNQMGRSGEVAGFFLDWFYGGDNQSVNVTQRILFPLLIACLGFMAGFFIVPLEAFVNHQTEAHDRGSVWAAANVLVAVSMILGGGFQALLGLTGSAGMIFLGAGLMMLFAGIVICIRFPTIPLRLMVLIFFRSAYKTRVRGLENIPKTGGALLAPNHQSYLDGILIASIVDRPVRFVMSQAVYHKWFVYPFAKVTRSIAIEQSQSPRELIHALREASEEIKAGGLVCLFPEGQLSRNGMIQPFRRGLERIMKDLTAPVIPVAIDGAYDTWWADRKYPPQHRNFRTRTRLNVVFGEPMSPETPIFEVRNRVVALLVDAFSMRKEESVALHRMAISQLRRAPFKRMYSDHSTDGLIPNLKVLAGICIMGYRFRDDWKDEEYVGILLPPAIGSMALNIAALLAGKIPVNLNYTSSKAILTKTCEIAGIRLVFTSKQFQEKAGFEIPDGMRVIYMEDFRASVTKSEQRAGLLRGLFRPIAKLEADFGRTKPAGLDDVATLIFSSGSTGVPKGVMLTHWNIDSNVMGALQYVSITKDARFLGILPFFHSFGYMSTLWLPLRILSGVSFHPSPLDARAIGAIVERYRVTHLWGTPTFLSNYMRRIEPGQFGSIRFVLAGAEKLKRVTADGFRARFGVMPIEGFGCTECSPTVAMNGEDYRAPGIFQSGVRFGTIGQPIPGVCVKIVHLETGEPVPVNESGMLLVRGPNVMKGYLNNPEKTAEVLRDGWYVTGDVASVDEEGFITIHDRLARFSKIGGEMVPHVKIEEALQNASGEPEPAFAVTGLPDEKKGERLAVIYTISEDAAKAALEAISQSEMNIPPLWLPKWQDFVKADKIPALGSGKLDLQQCKAIAAQALGESLK